MNENTVVIVTDANYDEVIRAATKPVLLAIGAQWCFDCRRIEPFFMEFAKRYADKVQFARCDFDSNPGIKEKFEVRHIPTIVLIKDGAVIETLVEPKSIAPFKEMIEKYTA